MSDVQNGAEPQCQAKESETNTLPDGSSIKPDDIKTDEAGVGDASKNSSTRRKHSICDFVKRLTTSLRPKAFQWLTAFKGCGTLLLGGGTLCVSLLTYLNAKDTAKIQEAVTNLSNLASQTQRQANNSDKMVRNFAKQFAEMHKQTVSLQASADAARGQLEEARAAQQPIITVTDPQLTRSTVPFPKWIIVINAWNGGNTPPKYAEVAYSAIEIPRVRDGLSAAQIENPEDPEVLLKRNYTIGQLAGGASRKVFGARLAVQVANVEIPEWQLTGQVPSKDGKGAAYNPRSFFLFGIIKYTDRIKPNNPHIVKFCSLIAVKKFETGNAGEPHWFPGTTPCNHWNCTDEQCITDKIAYERELSSELGIPENTKRTTPQQVSPRRTALSSPLPIRTFVVYFDSDQSSLSEAAKFVVSKAISTAKANGFAKVQIVGYADSAETNPDKVSLARAESVRDAMVRGGMKANGILIQGRGTHDPLVETPQGVREPQNRRTVIDLSP